MACGISTQGSNPCRLQWKCGVLTTGLSGKSPDLVLKSKILEENPSDPAVQLFPGLHVRLRTSRQPARVAQPRLGPACVLGSPPSSCHLSASAVEAPAVPRCQGHVLTPVSPHYQGEQSGDAPLLLGRAAPGGWPTTVRFMPVPPRPCPLPVLPTSRRLCRPFYSPSFFTFSVSPLPYCLPKVTCLMNGISNIVYAERLH